MFRPILAQTRAVTWLALHSCGTLSVISVYYISDLSPFTRPHVVLLCPPKHHTIYDAYFEVQTLTTQTVYAAILCRDIFMSFANISAHTCI